MDQIEQLDNYTDQLIDILITWGPKIVGALVFLIVGLWVAKLITRAVGGAMERRNLDPNLVPMLRGLTSMLLRVMVFISFIGMLGIEATSFIAILGAAGLAVGMALSGTLQNFAGGVMILIFKPYQKGDFIDAQGYTGTVNEIRVFNTILKTPDNKTIVIPNGPLSTGSLTNYSTEPKRRVDWTFGVGYGDNVDKAKEIIRNLCQADKRIHDDPAVFVALSELADSSVNFAVRAWVNAEDYWDVYFEMNEKVYLALIEAKLNIPYPQMDVHLHKVD